MWKQFFIAKYNNNSTIFSENSQSFFALQAWSERAITYAL